MDKKELFVFLYHEVVNNPTRFCVDYNLNVTPQLFRKQIEWIKKNFQIVSPKDLDNPSALPRKAALITFDDGFKGAFENGVTYLEKQGIPSIMFLNMGHIIDKSPLISSMAIYFSRYSNIGFVNNKFSNSKEFHLTINPSTYSEILKENPDYNYSKTLIYQGELASIEMLHDFSKSKFLFYGNHLYYHWNSKTLTTDDFTSNFMKNQSSLLQFENYINLFSFPNGQPTTCFNDSHLTLLKSLGSKKTFYSSGGTNLNSDSYLLNRMDLTEYEYNKLKLGIRILNARISNKFVKKVASLARKF
jgi:peptidoglycan/xylan/chitin deacetylase (PgdA/CDA1 family)